MTVKVKEVISPKNPKVLVDKTIFDALAEMTESGMGAVTVVDNDNNLKGIFTDGDLRRNLKEKGKLFLEDNIGEVVNAQNPITINADALLYEAVRIFKEKKVDNIIVLENNKPLGMIDIQDFVKMNLVG
jgi:CBS domain-containing protein